MCIASCTVRDEKPSSTLQTTSSLSIMEETGLLTSAVKKAMRSEKLLSTIFRAPIQAGGEIITLHSSCHRSTRGKTWQCRAVNKYKITHDVVESTGRLITRRFLTTLKGQDVRRKRSDSLSAHAHCIEHSRLHPHILST